MISKESRYDKKSRRGRKLRSYNWDMLDQNTSERENTVDFAEEEISSRKWVKNLWSEDAIKTAKGLLKSFGVKGTRRRAKIWVERQFV